MAKKKFYYQGQLIRTSANDYKFAVVIPCEDQTVFVVGCSATYAGADKIKRREAYRFSEMRRAAMKIVEISKDKNA